MLFDMATTHIFGNRRNEVAGVGPVGEGVSLPALPGAKFASQTIRDFEDLLVPPTPDVTPQGSLQLPKAVLAELRVRALLNLGHKAVALSQGASQLPQTDSK